MQISNKKMHFHLNIYKFESWNIQLNRQTELLKFDTRNLMHKVCVSLFPHTPVYDQNLNTK